LLYHGKTKVDPLGSDNPSGREPNAREHSQLYTSEGLLPEGSKFGGYVVGPCIGHGGMARIYRAEHEGLRRSVALKVLLDGFAQDPEGHERFLREGRIAAAIKHPNVVNIFDVGFQDSTPYLVMELLEGQDLEALMYSQGSMPESALVDIVVPIVAGLAAVHDAGVIHRDLKPGNIFLARGRNDELEPKLLDFGISKAAESEQFKLTTARGLLMGTPLYMSPEGIQGGEITPLSDQYSLGVVLYECCTGFNPFAADTLAETVRRVTMGDFPPVAQQNPAVSKRMARIVGRAMSLDPSHRFSSLREMGRELLYLAGQRTRITWSLSFGEVSPKRTGNASSFGSTPQAGSTPPPARSHGKVSSLAALLFGIALFALAGGLLWSARNSEPTGGPAETLQALKGGTVTSGPTPVSSGQLAPGVTLVPAARPPAAAPAAPTSASNAVVQTVERSAPVAPQPQKASPAAASRPQEAAAPVSTSRPSADRLRAALADEEERKRRASRPQTGRRRAAAPPAPARTAEPARAAAEPQKPDWVPSSGTPPAPSQQRRNTALGTNNAPIFE
jgi:eukaryotic-like serine/threonine-protein kinase